MGGATYFDSVTSRIYDTNFTGNVANKDGGAIYGTGNDILLYRVSMDKNSAKRGGAIFAQNVQVKIYDSALQFNTAEEKGGAIYRNTAVGSSIIENTRIINNTAFQGSAIYTVSFFNLINTVLLDNQANSNKFIDKHVGVDDEGRNYTSAVFVGYDNLLNAIWCEEDYIGVACNNVTYWDANGITISNSRPRKSNCEAGQNITVEMFNEDGEKINESVVVTDEYGEFVYYFNATPGETYYFSYIHYTDRYYTYLRDTLSNRSLVKVYVYNPLYHNQNQTILISLTDGAWGDLNGTVIVNMTGPLNKTYTIEVINGTYSIENISGLPLGRYNVTATFDGDLDHTGDSDWVIFDVLPYDDLHITKDVNITADYVNVTDIIKYTINVTNHGPSEGRSVNVTEILSPYLKLIKSNATRGSYNYTGGYWYIGDLGVNETVTLTIIAQVIHEGPIVNTVWVTGFGNDTNLTNDIDSAHNFTALNIVDLRIVKEINATDKTINVTDIIKYTITVYNDGPCNATGVIVSEVLDYHLSPISINASVGTFANGTWNIGRLNNASNATLTIVARVIYSGNITNEVGVTCFENDTNMSNNYDNVTNIAIAYVDLQIIKEVNVTGFVNVTDKIKFTIHIYNSGPANAVGVYVSEILNEHLRMISSNVTIGEYDGATWVIGTLNKGEVHNLTIIAEVISVGNISNAVNITGIDNDTNMSNNNDSIKNITALPIVDLEIIKEVTRGGSIVNVNDEIEFTISVINHGPCTATDINVTEILSQHLKMTGNYTEHGYYNVTEGIWHVGDLTNQSRAVLRLVCKVISNGTISNFVVVSSHENDTNTSNNNDTIDNITALPVVDLVITKEVNVSVVNVSGKIKFTINVTNNGPSNATHVYVNEVLSPNLKLISNITGYGYYNVTEGIWHIGNLNNGSTANLTLVCEVRGNGTIVNYVKATSYENDTDLSNNEYLVSFIAHPIVDVSIVKTVNVNSSTIVNIGQEIIFTITVHNSGPSNATGVWVSEVLDYAHLKIISNTTSKGHYDGFSWVIDELNGGATENLTIVCEVIASGNISNYVIVYSNENDTNISNNYDNITNITSEYLVDLAITKTAEIWGVAGNVAKVGDVIQFTINVNNYGPCDATNVTVVEVLDSHLNMTSYSVYGGDYNVTTGIWYIGDLTNPGFAQLIILTKVISPGNISNFVSINSTENDTNKSNNNDTIDNITALPVVDLVINKQVNASIVTVGDLIEFNITVYNKGPCNATQVNVSEILNDNLQMIDNRTDTGYYNLTGGYWYIGELNVGSNATLTIVCQIISDGIIPNYVDVTSYENDTYPYDNWDMAYVSTVPIVDVSITKEVNVTSNIVNVGELIEFTITVHNFGPSDATGVYVGEIITDPLHLVRNITTNGTYRDGTWYIGNLANNATETLTLICEVMYIGNITNYVEVFSYQNDTNMSNNKDNITNLTAVVNVDVGIIKTVNVTGFVNVNDYVEFNITVYNNGTATATSVTVIEALDYYHLELISNTTTKGTYDGYSWDIGTLDKGEVVNMTLIVRVKAPGSFGNMVSVRSFENDTNMSNNNDTIDNITALPVVDLEITKNVTKGNRIVNVTDEIEFTITIRNNGPCDATNVTVVEVLSPHLKMTDNITWKNYYDVNTGIWYVGSLLKNESAILIIKAVVISNGTISNFVVINSTENDTNKSNNNDTIDNITALPLVDLNITKVVNVTSGFVNVSDCVKYTINVTNNGPSNATGVVAFDKLSNLLEFVSFVSSREGITYDNKTGKINIGNLDVNETVSLDIIAKVIGNGTISNMVNVTSYENDTNVTNNNDTSDNVTALPVTNLAVIKYSNVTSAINVNDLVKFTINVTNYGPSNATWIEISDELIKEFEFVNATGNWTRNGKKVIWTIPRLNNGTTASVDLIVRVLNNGTFENIAFAKSNENITEVHNKTNVTANPIVDVRINKTVNVTEVNVGDNIKYTIHVVNKGPSDATDVYVIDKLSNLLEFVSFESSRSDVTYDEGTGKSIIGNLKVNETVILYITAEVRVNGTIPNTVNVTSHENDTNLTNNNYTCDNVTAEIYTPIKLNVYDIYYGDDEIITVTLPKYATGVVNITINGKPYDNISIDNGIATLPVFDLGGGDYHVEVTYGGDGIYNPNSTSGDFKVLPLTPTIKIEVVDIWVGEVEVLNVTVNAPGTVNITVNGKTIEIPLDHQTRYTELLMASNMLDYDGKATWVLIGLPVGTYPAFAIYNGNENYTSVNTSDVFHVRDKPSTVIVTADDIYVGEDAIINVQVGPEGTYGSVVVEVDGRNYTLTLDNTRKATLTVPGLSAGLKHVTVWYNGTILYRPSQSTTTFNVLKLKPPVDIDAPTIHVGEDGKITVTVPGDATGKITIEIDGKKYAADIRNGKAVFIIPGLKAGIHDIKAYYYGDGKYLSANATGKINVIPDEDKNGSSKKHELQGLAKHPTGNPIGVLLIVLLSSIVIYRKKSKK